MKVAIPFVAALLVSCASMVPVPQYTSVYDITLTGVDRQTRGGETKHFTPSDNTFEDEYIRIAWRPDNTQLPFTLTNKTDASMRIVWDEASFVSRGGKTDRIIHEGVKLAASGQAMPQTTIIRGGTLQDLIEPAGSIYWRRGYGTYDAGGWEHVPLVGSETAPTEAEIRAKLTPDSSIKVLLPVDSNGTVREYLFEFGVKGRIVPPSSGA